jgi:hypothetical protein
MTDGWLSCLHVQMMVFEAEVRADTFDAANTSFEACRSGSIRPGSQGKAYPGFLVYLPTPTADSVYGVKRANLGWKLPVQVTRYSAAIGRTIGGFVINRNPSTICG